MAQKVVIVESPAKARTINRFLGDGWRVCASVGHVRDLPKREFGVDTEDGFRPKYVLIPGRRKTVAFLKKAVKDAEAVYLATDMDREGEAIAWHIKETLKIPDDKCFRVTFTEITSRAIKNAFASPGEISMSKVFAQQARRILDRIVGYRLSPFLWKRFFPGLSAGRVQSVALRLVVEREREIGEFESRLYWLVHARIETPKGESFDADVVNEDGKALRFESETEALEVAEKLRGATAQVTGFERKEREQTPFPPHTTATLQREMAASRNMSPSETMRHAQSLYEGVETGGRGRRGLITYHRTDSVRVAEPALAAARRHLKEVFGERYLPARARRFKIAPGAQAAHEAIRPTDVSLTPEEAKKHLKKRQALVYEAVWRRFVASQTALPLYEETTLNMTCEGRLLRAFRRTLAFDGYLKIYGRPLSTDDSLLPEAAPGDALGIAGTEVEQRQTEPPPRYTESSLVKTLEKEGIGRPSTYAGIIETLYDRRYMLKRKARLYSTELGERVARLLVDCFPNVMDVGFTRKVEERLDRIEGGEEDWRGVLHEFNRTFEAELEAAVKKPAAAERKCPECGRPLLLRYSRGKPFWGCSGYDEKDENGERACRYRESVGKKKPVIRTGRKCERCGSELLIRWGRFGPFLACSGFPKCRFSGNLSAAEKRELKKRAEEGEDES